MASHTTGETQAQETSKPTCYWLLSSRLVVSVLIICAWAANVVWRFNLPLVVVAPGAKKDEIPKKK